MRLKSDLLLLLAAAVWGSGFVAQSLAADRMSPFAFNGTRFLLAALLLMLLLRFRLTVRRDTLLLTILAGSILFGASALQQAGLRTTSVANASFITGTYVVLVPFLLSLFWKQKFHFSIWVAALLALAGIFLLSMQAEMRFTPGDELELAGALLWAMHVIVVGRLAQKGNILQTMVIQFFVSGLLNLLTALLIDPSGLKGLNDGIPAVLYSAVFPVAVGFTLQMVGQKHAPPVDAAIILSMETVFGALFGYFFLAEDLGLQQVIGCGMILAAMLLAQFPISPAGAVSRQPTGC